MSLVMTSPPSTRHHLLTPAASLGRPSTHQKHAPPATLPISVPTRKSANMPTSPNSRRNRDPSPDMLFEMSPTEDAPIHYAAFAAPPVPSPAPSLPIATKNRLSLVDASLTPSRTAPIPVNSRQPEPFLYAFPVLSPAAKSAPQSLPSRGRLRNGDHLKSHPHTPSPPFGRSGGGQAPAHRITTSSTSGAIISAFHGGESFDDSDFDDPSSYGASPVAAHWAAGRANEAHAPPIHVSSYRGDVRQYELERGRARAPKHRGH
ncbi:hypothetical protein K488DRAFT_88681 [Vararia minispora EC-137]|uniref:Uncharacterized protein n=1 Tax=Vararia minispora EC-137 TaxID=1314806 RepID=A0ACB8QCV2_9AGAM|nr:hypothetical protein K488DRAFT_88681 [Vararia minispora EC-137]